MSDEKYDQILKILEANDCYCTDDETDREALAKVLKNSLFPEPNRKLMKPIGTISSCGDAILIYSE